MNGLVGLTKLVGLNGLIGLVGLSGSVGLITLAAVGPDFSRAVTL